MNGKIKYINTIFFSKILSQVKSKARKNEIKGNLLVLVFIFSALSLVKGEAIILDRYTNVFTNIIASGEPTYEKSSTNTLNFLRTIFLLGIQVWKNHQQTQEA